VPSSQPNKMALSIQAGVLSWLIPGAGHWRLGYRGLAVIFFLAVTFPFWTGMALGGVLGSANLATNKWLLLAEAGAGGYTLPCWLISLGLDRQILDELNATQPAHQRLTGVPDQQRDSVGYDKYLRAAYGHNYMSDYPGADVAQIYLTAAGLLNLLVILDAISRAQTGLPTFQRELRLREQHAEAAPEQTA
jgi:hypothetical protein